MTDASNAGADDDGISQRGQDPVVLEMPFVVCASSGGPADDGSFIGGWECGSLDQELLWCRRLEIEPEPRYVYTWLLDQVDLIAMRHGMSIVKTAHDDPEWTLVAFY